MKPRSRSIIILGILFGYILLQFLWWEILLVRQNDKIIAEKQKLIELSSTNEQQLRFDVAELHRKKSNQTLMIVGEGMVFLLLLIFGVYKIKQALDKENELNNQQKNFFLSVTHELKTPIAATKLQLQTLQKQKLEEHKQRELLANALMETERLNMLIDNILLASSLENRDMVFKLEKEDLGELSQQILQRYYRDELNHHVLRVETQAGIFAAIDRNMFPSILTNLVDNAIKYSPQTKAVTVCIEQKNQEVILSVKDQGMGISDKDKPRVFQKFFRAGNEDTRSTKGTGLGLYIVSYILKKHGASIRVMDNQPQGSIFEITFHAH